MTLFNRHESCIGLTLFRFGQWNIEIWYCPPGYVIKPHSHPHEHIELMYLFGKSTFYRGERLMEESYRPRWHNFGMTFTVKPGVVHWFKVSTWPLVFINIAKFTKGHKPVSASKDFKHA